MKLTSKDPVFSRDFFRDEFIKLALLSRDFPYGLAIFDRELRHILVNEHMATISATPVERYTGRTIREVDPGVAVAMEPVLRHAIEKGEQLVDVEVEVPGPLGADTAETGYWLVSCYPLKTDAGNVKGAAAVVRDISGQKSKDTAQEELLKFEAILSDLSAAFINIPISEVDRKIEQGLQKIVDFLGFDRCSIWQFSTDDGRLHCTHSYALPGIKQPAPIVDDVVPVWTSMTLRGEIFRVSDVDELTDEFWREKQYCKDMGGIKSFLFIPLNVGGTVVGLLSFASCHAKKLWPDLLIQRLRLFWDIIGNALERKRADQMIQKALAEIRLLKDRLEAENLYLRDQIDVEYKHEEIVGQSDAIRKVLLKAEQVAHTDSTVLILGETGTGKELVARAIHNMSGRRGRAMIKLNCAALPATLIEAELFGREKGAYTGASTTQIGRFEAANGSTIFLDEIGELPLELQSKLLRVLQEGQFERLGSTKPIEVDVRVIAATNRDLAQAVRQGNFREDLYYRLNVFPIGVPPLRERSEDVPALVWAMVKEFGKVFGKTIERIPKKNMDALRSYHWPGNVRELRNMIERAMILNNGTTLVVELPDTPSTISSQATSLEEMERMHILAVMVRCGWRVRGKHGAAEILRLKPTTLDSKMKKLGIRRNPLTSEIS
ncbi:sigma 54-interacting transcriptional regulator [Geobacter sp. AOG1]|uniref:sigma 54-interacting transcriptional regulator n=1 Tax=Geobacter sp. AOG1 TaxID=1566346 RepID=UPI001CC4F750|nr:sigma 54-interacting transcriptional regulator [Geobacter sp. AOG1]GFE56302.1 transcriptional regulator FhlA [Geobacter sp. AOG1]